MCPPGQLGGGKKYSSDRVMDITQEPGEGQTMVVVALRKAIKNLTNPTITFHSKPSTYQ
jgi:hypothetical protein